MLIINGWYFINEISKKWLKEMLTETIQHVDIPFDSDCN